MIYIQQLNQGRIGMKRISTVELLRNFGAFSDVALAEPIILTKNGRDRLVLISLEQYSALQQNYGAFDGARHEAIRERGKPAPVNTRGQRKS